MRLISVTPREFCGILSYEFSYFCILGDGRNDSPGHSSQYCSYTIINHLTGAIVSMLTDSRHFSDYKSPNMELKLARESLLSLLAKGVNIAEFVTDAHVQVGKMMSK